MRIVNAADVHVGWCRESTITSPFSSPALRSLHGRPVVLDLWIYQSYLPHSPLSPHANDEMNASIMAMLAWLDRARH